MAVRGVAAFGLGLRAMGFRRIVSTCITHRYYREALPNRDIFSSVSPSTQLLKITTLVNAQRSLHTSFPLLKKGLIIDADGSSLGTMTVAQAEDIAKEKNFELKLVRHQQNAPNVYKLIDPVAAKHRAKERARKAKKEEIKRREEAKRVKKKTKEVQLSAWCSDHDMEMKVKQMRGFLEKDLNVKLVIKHKRGQVLDKKKQLEVIGHIQELTEDVGTAGNVAAQGIFQTVMFAPKPKEEQSNPDES